MIFSDFRNSAVTVPYSEQVSFRVSSELRKSKVQELGLIKFRNTGLRQLQSIKQHIAQER